MARTSSRSSSTVFTTVSPPSRCRSTPPAPVATINSPPGGGNPDWDGVWDVKARRTEEGWVAEYQVPFKTLRFSGVEKEWGLQIARRIVRLNEESMWSPVPFSFPPARMNMAGTMRGLENVSQGMNLKIKPYIVGQVTQATIGGELQKTKTFDDWEDYRKGFDVKYSLTPSLTLDTTYRTDFAQVEADAQQVNLTRFNLFFPEKREFFLENQGTFAFGPGGNLVPFFSRRIGLRRPGTPCRSWLAAGHRARSGKYSVGVLAMRTDEFGLTTPANNYAVARAKRNMFTNSWIGALGTHRDSTIDGDFNRVYGADAHFQFYDRLEFDSYLLRSDTPGKAAESGAAISNRLERRRVGRNAKYNAIQPKFNPEVGFIRRGNNTNYPADVTW